MILKLKVLLSPFIYLFLIFNIPPAQAIDLCIEGKKQLNRDYQLMQKNGGLLALMKQTDSLKNSAGLGGQIDDKLLRMITFFETICRPGSKANPTIEVYGQIQKGIDRGNFFLNRNLGKTTPDEYLNEMVSFNLDLEKFWERYGF